MKNIILVAQSTNDFTESERMELVKKILDSGDYQIILLVLPASADKEAYTLIPGVCEVLDSRELEYRESMKGLDFDTISGCRDLQMNIESAFYRLYGDFQLDKYSYYAALSYWNDFFKRHRVDFVIHTKPFHGYAHDCCDLVARERNVKFFHVQYIGYNKSYGFYTAETISRFKLLPVFDHRCINIPYLLDSGFDKTKSEPSSRRKVSA